MISSILMLVGFGLAAFVLGALTAEGRIRRRVFSPWLRSIPTSDPDYWLRSRDYSAAWNGFCRASVIPKPSCVLLQFTNGGDVVFATPPRDLLTKETR